MWGWSRPCRVEVILLWACLPHQGLSPSFHVAHLPPRQLSDPTLLPVLWMPYSSLCSLVFFPLKPTLPLLNAVWLCLSLPHEGPAELSFKGIAPSPGWEGLRLSEGALGLPWELVDFLPDAFWKSCGHLSGLIR